MRQASRPLFHTSTPPRKAKCLAPKTVTRICPQICPAPNAVLFPLDSFNLCGYVHSPLTASIHECMHNATKIGDSPRYGLTV